MSIKETITVWFKAARAPFLVVSIIPALLGGAIAYHYGMFNWLQFVLVTIGIVSAHSAADFIDDYFDFKNGNLGNKEQQFHDSPLIHGEVTLKQVMAATIICLAISVGIGIYLLLEVGTPVIYLALAGAFIVFFYTSPPIRLNYRGLGETALFFAFGPMIVFGVFFVLTKHFSMEPLLASIPLGIFTMNVGIVSNIFDYEDDVKSGKKCMPVRIGQPNTWKVLMIVSMAGFLVIPLAVILHIMPLWTLIGILTIPLGLGVLKSTKNFRDVSFYTGAMSKAIALSSVTGILLIVAYTISIFSQVK